MRAPCQRYREDRQMIEDIREQYQRNGFIGPVSAQPESTARQFADDYWTMQPAQQKSARDRAGALLGAQALLPCNLSGLGSTSDESGPAGLEPV